MKYLLIIALLALSSTTLKATTYGKFKVYKYHLNDINHSTELASTDQYLFFVKTEGNDFFINKMVKKGTYSFGAIINLETNGKFATFSWKYENSYNNDSGTALVSMTEMETGNKRKYYFKIITQKKDLIEYWCIGGFNSEEERTETEDNGKFRKDYNKVAFYTMKDDSWSEWFDVEHTFVFNINENGDIKHYKENGTTEVYRKVSEVEEGQTDDGEKYQIITTLDAEGDEIRLQLFSNSSIGLKLMYKGLMVQFASN